MSDSGNDEKIGADEILAGATNTGKADYKVGRGRPPEEYKWKKGQSGNPKGRPRKKLDQKAALEQMMNERIVIREDGRERRITKYDAVLRSHMAKAIKGDARSAKFVMEQAARLGVGDEQEGGSVAPLRPNAQSRQSEALFANLDLDLLTDEDKIELARLGQIIDLGGDFTALGQHDFELAKHIANKGRGNVAATDNAASDG